MNAETVLTGDGPEVKVGEQEVAAMAQALRAGLATPELVATGGVPDAVMAQVRRDFPPEPLSIADQARAGAWLLVTTPEGPRWDLRIATPGQGRMGLLLRVPLVRTREGAWRARSIEFVRVSPPAAR